MTRSSTPDSKTLRLHAPAKVNLGLWVRRKRPDGYHDLETVFLPIPLCDTLDIRLHDGPDVLTCDDPDIPVNGENLVLQAIAALRHAWGTRAPEQGFRIHLKKRIPACGGLGGGSSDCGAVLQGVPNWLGLPISHRRLAKVALLLGSDVPLFLQPRLCVARGRGERMRSLNWSLRGNMVLVLPDVRVSTPWAFQRVKPRGEGGGSLTRLLRPALAHQRGLPDGCRLNDFEPPVFSEYPILREYQENLQRRGARLAGMSGSGSTLFGLFSEIGAARAARREIRARRTIAHLLTL